jgi:hypothetical protein
MKKKQDRIKEIKSLIKFYIQVIDMCENRIQSLSDEIIAVENEEETES